MKVLLVVESHFKEYGGPYTAISQAIEYFNKRKIYIKLIYNKSNYFRYKLDLNYIIKDFDIVHIYGVWKPFLLKVFFKAKSLKKKIIISPIGALEPWSLNQKKIKKKIAWHLYQRYIMNNTDIIHATSEIEAKNLLDKNLKTKIVIIGHGLEIDKVFVPEIKKNKKKKILFFSRIHSKKGLIELISIWKNLKKYKEWELDIYGPISDMSYFKKMIKTIKEFGLEKNIFYLGSIFEIEKKKIIYRKADGFILPSKSENFGISIGEALSHGLPVLTTFRTPWKIINNYKAGYVFNFSIEDIEKNLNTFMNLSDEERYEMSLKAIRVINENFSSDKIFLMYENLYKNILK